MGHAREVEIRVGVEAFPVKTIKERGGSGAIKAAVVKAQADSGHERTIRAFLQRRRRAPSSAKPFTMRWAETKVKLKPIRKKQSRPAKWAALYVMNRQSSKAAATFMANC